MLRCRQDKVKTDGVRDDRRKTEKGGGNRGRRKRGPKGAGRKVINEKQTPSGGARGKQAQDIAKLGRCAYRGRAAQRRALDLLRRQFFCFHRKLSPPQKSLSARLSRSGNSHLPDDLRHTLK